MRPRFSIGSFSLSAFTEWLLRHYFLEPPHAFFSGSFGALPYTMHSVTNEELQSEMKSPTLLRLRGLI
jgi:hypothetical protein